MSRATTEGGIMNRDELAIAAEIIKSAQNVGRSPGYALSGRSSPSPTLL